MRSGAYERRKRVAMELAAGIAAIVPLLDDPDRFSGDFGVSESEVSRLHARAQELHDRCEAQEEQVGRGHTALGWKATPFVQPKSDVYEFCVLRPERFQELTRFTVGEFESLHTDVYNVLEMRRDIHNLFTEEENAKRRKRRFKHGSRERLFHFLWWLTHYSKFKEMCGHTNMCRSACFYDFMWLRLQLCQHPLLVAEVHWPSPHELEAQRSTLVQCGVLEPPFDNCTFMYDGTKDLGRRTAHYNHRHEPDYSQKGNGKSHLLVLPRPALP